MRLSSALGAALVLACGADPAEPGGFGEGVTAVASLATGDGSAAWSSSSSGSEPVNGSTTTTGGDSAWSTGSSSTGDMPDLGVPGPAGCLGKIDFLFVISSGGGMAPKQERLLKAFPGFIGAIEQHLPGFDTHVMVVNPDGWWGMDDCSVCDPEDCDPQGALPMCGAQLTACDTTLGAGFTFPAGKGSSNQRCEFVSGRPYITREEPSLIEAFQCVAQVGISGTVPKPAEAMVRALGDDFNGPGGCHPGFLRKEALLVVTLISDIAEEASDGFVEDWVEVLYAAKKGDGDAFMVLALSTDIDVPLPLCNGFSGYKNRLRLLAEAVPHGAFGSICLDDYVPFFEAAVASIVPLCDEFIPQ